MENWIVRGTLNGQRQKWRLEGSDEQSVRSRAESKGVSVESVTAEPRELAKQHVQAVEQIVVTARVVPVRVQKCGNCGTEIGRLESPHVWHEEIVCVRCYAKLVAPHELPARTFPAPPPAVQHSPPAAPQVVVIQAPAHQAPAPNIHVSNAAVTNVYMRRGCLSSLVHGVFKMIFIAVFIVIVVVVIGLIIASQNKH